MKAFLAYSCLVAVVLADGPGGHHHPHPAPLPLARPFARGPAVIPAAPLVAAHPPPLLPAPAPYRPAPPPYRPAPIPAYGPAPIPAYGPAPVPAYGAGPVYPDTPPAYDFGYGVQINDYHGAANFGHNENRNGYTTNGEYRVDLPDGRTQIVTYNVNDAQSGYVADVKYINNANPIPPPRPAYGPAPVPAYAPAPIRPAYGRVPLPAPVPLRAPIVPVHAK